MSEWQTRDTAPKGVPVKIRGANWAGVATFGERSLTIHMSQMIGPGDCSMGLDGVTHWAPIETKEH